MSDVTSAPRTCEICGVPIRSNNRVGICTTTPECIRERARRARQDAEVRERTSNRKKCQHPDGCPKWAWSHGWCEMHWRRVEKDGEPGPVGRLWQRSQAISAGTVLGTWTVLEDYRCDGAVFPIRCECGNERLVTYDALLKWGNKPCVCGRKGKPLGRPMAVPPGKRPYLTVGSVFGRLTLLENAYFTNDRVHVRCECGSEVTTRANSLKFGISKSCGCISRERSTTHGLSKHPLYFTWYSMIDRCTNSDHKQYAAYGGRGITVCDRWLGLPDGLQNFIADMGPKLTSRHSLDRTNVHGNYEPGNCKWETPDIQALHRRSVAELTRERDALLIRVAEQDAKIAELEAMLALRPATLF